MIPGLVIPPKFMGCCVYVWKRNNPDDADTVMYVGSSSRGIRRLSIGHHALPLEFTEDDYVEVYACSSQQTMLARSNGNSSWR